MVVVVGNLLALGQVKLVAFIVHEQHLALPHLINLGRDNHSHAILVFLVEGVVLQLQDFRCQRLSQVKDGSAAELLELHTLTDFLAYLVVRLDFLRVVKRYFLVLVLYFAVGHNHAVAVDFKVALVGVHDDVEILVRPEHLCNDVSETLFKHAHQCGAVDVFCLFKLLKGLNH